MKTILLIAALNSCPEPEMQNHTTQPWNADDLRILEHAKKNCASKYPHSPCMKVFRKVNILTYHVICGTNNDTERYYLL